MPCLQCLSGAMNILPGVPYLSDAHFHALGRCGSAYLDDAAAPGGRSRSLQEAGLGVPGGPCGAWQCDPAATVPHPATRSRGCSVPGGSVGGGSGVVFASGSVERHRTLPTSRALGHGQARFGSSRRARPTPTSSPRQGCAQAPGESPAGLGLSARQRLQRSPQLCGEETSLGQRRPRAVVQEVSGPARAGGGGRGEDASGREKQAEKQREVPEM